MASNPLRQDPTRTVTLRRRYIADMKRRMRLLESDIRELVVSLDVFGLKPDPTGGLSTLQLNVEAREWQFQTDAKKVELFNLWFADRVSLRMLEVNGITGDPWSATYVESAYRKGVNRAFTEANKADLINKPDFFEGTKAQFLNETFNAPETVSKLKLLFTRSFEDLKGISAAMSSDMSRILADGLSAGLSPSVIAREMTNRIETLGRTRAAAIARTEIVHAHAEGQLDSFERLGIKKLKAIVEFSTAGDDRVCPTCAALEGKTFTVKEARGVIPVHVQCRCVWTISEEAITTNLFKKAA